MATRLYSVVIDAADVRAQAEWWAEALGWSIVYESDDEISIAAADDPSFGLVFVAVDDPKLVKNRVHLDIASASERERDEQVATLLAAGATRVDIGQGEASWEVLADPEGNEFCVLGPSGGDPARSRLAAVVLDAVEPRRLAPFWAAATGRVATEPDGDGDFRVVRGDGGGVPLDILAVPEPHTVKNRLHLEVAPQAGDDQGAEVARLEALGATHVDLGQGEQSWVVLADPEGNEFCVLSPRDE